MCPYFQELLPTCLLSGSAWEWRVKDSESIPRWALRKRHCDAKRKRGRTEDKARHEDEDRRTPYEQGISASQGSGATKEP